MQFYFSLGYAWSAISLEKSDVELSKIVKNNIQICKVNSSRSLALNKIKF
jgi:hypothetical protein